jgi:hypothetical protein
MNSATSDTDGPNSARNSASTHPPEAAHRTEDRADTAIVDSGAEPTSDCSGIGAMAEKNKARAVSRRRVPQADTEQRPSTRTPLECVATALTPVDQSASDPAAPKRLSVETLISVLPAPHEPLSDSAELLPQERDERERYEHAMDFAEEMFWVQGECLRGIWKGALYRDSHPTFGAYVTATRDMTVRRAYQLMEIADLARFLHVRTRKNLRVINLNEAQARALLPLAKRHGHEAAAAVFEAAVASDHKVTAALLRGAAAVIPANRFDPREVETLLRDYLTAEQCVLPPSERADKDSPGESAATWDSEAKRLCALVRRTVTHPAFRAAARARPDQARAIVNELRAFLDEVEATAITPNQP